ncbi:hypothetical protein H6M51_22005 [Rhizobium sp. AQ_MP]|nr:hypothetical protein [Rhizobium sp. AQ_MP]
MDVIEVVQGFLYLCAVADWCSWNVLSWRLPTDFLIVRGWAKEFCAGGQAGHRLFQAGFVSE